MFIEYGDLCTKVYEISKPVATSINGDLEFYKDFLLKSEGKVLEAGVGTGRMLIPLKQADIDIVGVDVSPKMLEMCRLNAEKQGVEVEIFEQDLSELDLPYYFESIIMPTGSFSLLPGRETAKKVLMLFKDHLVDGGKIVIDLELPKDFVAGHQQVSSFKLSDTQGILFSSTDASIDWEEQRTTAIHRYEKWELGCLVESELSEFVLYWYGINEFKMILSEIGYRNIGVISDYGKNTSEKNIYTFIAEK